MKAFLKFVFSEMFFYFAMSVKSVVSFAFEAQLLGDSLKTHLVSFAG